MSTDSGCPGQAHGCPVEEKSQLERVSFRLIFYFIVILGLDPRIQGLSKQFSVTLDCRVTPGNDNKILVQRLDLQPEKLNRTAVGQARA
jgi:hypothetical protein